MSAESQLREFIPSAHLFLVTLSVFLCSDCLSIHFDCSVQIFRFSGEFVLKLNQESPEGTDECVCHDFVPQKVIHMPEVDRSSHQF